MFGDDDGLAWLCVLSAWMNNVLIGAINGSFSLIYIDIIDKFNTSATAAAFTGNLCIIVRYVLAPVISILTERFGMRAAVFTGAAIQFISYTVCGLASSFYLFATFYGIFLGIGHGLIFLPGQVMLGYSVDKRKGLAFAIASTGGGIGGFVQPIIYYYLRTEYGVFGAMLLFGTLGLHMGIGAIFYKTQSKEQNKNAAAKKKQTEELIVLNAEDKTEGMLQEVVELRTFETNGSNNSVHFKSGVTINKEKHLGTQINKEQQTGVIKVSKSKLHVIMNLKIVPFYVYSIFNLCAISVYYAFFVALLIEKGFKKSEASFLLSTSGVSSLVNGLVVCFLYDINAIRRHKMALIGLFLSLCGLSMVTIPLISSPALLALAAVVFGASHCPIIFLRTPILKDIVGEADLSLALAVVFVGCAVGHVIGPVFGGLLVDVTKLYCLPFYLVGAILLLCGVCGLVHDRYMQRFSVA